MEDPLENTAYIHLSSAFYGRGNRIKLVIAHAINLVSNSEMLSLMDTIILTVDLFPWRY